MIQVYKQGSYFGNVEITEDILSIGDVEITEDILSKFQ